MGLSTIVITQQLTSISKPYRDNISRVVSFYDPNQVEMKVIFHSYVGHTSKSERKNIKYSTLEINVCHPYDHKMYVIIWTMACCKNTKLETIDEEVNNIFTHEVTNVDEQKDDSKETETKRSELLKMPENGQICCLYQEG